MRSLDLGGDDVFDSLGDIRLAAVTGGGGAEAATRAGSEVRFERGAGHVGDRGAAPLSLVAKSGVKII